MNGSYISSGGFTVEGVVLDVRVEDNFLTGDSILINSSHLAKAPQTEVAQWQQSPLLNLLVVGLSGCNFFALPFFNALYFFNAMVLFIFILLFFPLVHWFNIGIGTKGGTTFTGTGGMADVVDVDDVDDEEEEEEEVEEDTPTPGGNNIGCSK